MVLPPGPVVASTEAEHVLFNLVDLYDRAYAAAAAETSLSPAQACVLGRLEDPRGMGALAEELGCDASNITQIVKRLETLGLVMRQQDPQDRRARVVVRTPHGDAVNRAFEDAFTFARSAVHRLSAKERKQLTALVRKALGDTQSRSG